MIFDDMGLPKDTGASDLQDSSRLAGIMATFGHPKAPNCALYRVNGKYVRHPKEYRYTFSRDQTTCLFAGLAAQGLQHMVDANYATEGDIVSPSYRDHFRRCAGIRIHSFLGSLNLKLDILWHSKLYPLNESNQILSVLAHADIKYLKMWTSLNKKWKESITLYWNGWRGEPELSELMISKVERRLSSGLDFWAK